MLIAWRNDRHLLQNPPAPVQYLIYIVITALSRHLVIDVQNVSDKFHLYLLAVMTIVVLLLSAFALILSYTTRKFSRPKMT